MATKTPRLVIAGLSGDSGKTLVSLSLLAMLRQKGMVISVFKKGPDYIDAAWLGFLTGTACRNLDTYMVTPNNVLRTFVINAVKSELAVIEGNRGIFDGKDIAGTHSTASLAKLLKAPVVLVINCTKATRTIAALVKGCQTFDPDLNIIGVILNRVARPRHQNIIAESIKKYCNLPVLGSIPKIDNKTNLIPGRHLGLIPPSEFEAKSNFTSGLHRIAEKYLDVEKILELAQQAPALDVTGKSASKTTSVQVRIGYFKDPVFTFYYPENLEALRANGAELVEISSIEDKSLPNLNALYIGGGFPETHANLLAQNISLLNSIKEASDNGLPIYAECGGLIYLSRSILWKEQRYPMAGVFPIDLKMNPKPIGHGYVKAEVDYPNPFYKIGTILKGHEFHYSGLIPEQERPASCMKVISGTGLGNQRDGLTHKNTLACYTHIHSDGVVSWASGIVTAALKYKLSGNNDSPTNIACKTQ